MEPTYSDLAQLARICARTARITASREAARELWRMALEYQRKAAALAGGKLFPDIGSPPSRFKE